MSDSPPKDSEIVRFAWERNQRALLLVLGVVVAVLQAIAGSYVFAAIFLGAFILIYATYGQTQTRLDPDGVTWRGGFGRKHAEWSQVKALAPGRALGVRQVRISVEGEKDKALPAPIDGPLMRDSRFAEKAERIRSYAALHGAPLGVEEDAREDVSS